MALAFWGVSLPLSRFFTPANGLLIQTLALGALIAGGAIVYLGVAQATGAANYKSLWRAVVRG